MHDPLRNVLERLEGVRPHQDGQGWEARCPAHEDRRQSLGVATGEGGKVLLYCQAGCSVENVCRALGLETRNLFPGDDPPPRVGGPGRVVATYDYRDEGGVVLYQVVRFHPKDFRQRRPGPSGGWVWNLHGVVRVLYRLPELLSSPADQPAYVVEGEKDVEALRALGLVATTNVGGAGKWRPEYDQAFRDRRVVVLPDNDDAGRAHAVAVRDRLRGVASAVSLVELPGLPPKGDVSDWLAAGGDAARLQQLAREALSAGQEVFPDPIPASLLARASAARAWLWHGYVARGEVTLFSALWKAGKTTLLAHLIKTLGAGGVFCGREVSPSRVLYVTEESETRWAERRDALGIEDHTEFLVRPFPSRPRTQRWLEFIGYLKKLTSDRQFDLVILDTLINLWPVKDENDAACVQAALMPLHQVCDRAGVLAVHHNRKSDGQEATAARGSGALSGFVDTIVEFRRYRPGDRQDRKRVLTGYGRHEETPEELVIELGQDGYLAHGDKSSVRGQDITQIILQLLPAGPAGWTADEILDRWPDSQRPLRNDFYAVLRAGVEDGRWQKEGNGTRGNPGRYFRPHRDDDKTPWERSST